MKILFLIPYPKGKAPSQRFRFEQYLDFFAAKNIQPDLLSFYNERSMQDLYSTHLLRKIKGLLKGFIKRISHLSYAAHYDIVFIHREAAPIGPPIFEWVIARVLKKEIIYDFDDAIWLPNVSDVNKKFSTTKWYGKVKKICQWSSVITCGNKYLADYAGQFNTNVKVIPTTIDTEHYHNQVKNQQTSDVVIGWTGSHTTGKYLKNIEPVIKLLIDKYKIKFVVISNQEPDFDPAVCAFVKWQKKTEITDLLEFNIGIMPLEDNEWERGKCGFKALQYMALGIPPVASPVGANNEIIQDGENGFLANTKEEWVEKLGQLIKSEALRVKMGQKARETVIEKYSVLSQRDEYLKVFNF